MNFRSVIICSILLSLFCAQVVLCAPASVSEGSISISTYAYEKGLYTPLPDDRLSGYPYPALRFHDVASEPTPRDYRSIVLENDYLKVVILPDLGGRIYRLIYKPTGQSVLYENDPLKPNIWTEQGWWMSTGGMEWCFPITEHSSNTLQPWRYSIQKNQDGSATVTVSDTHLRTGLAESVGITLKPDSCALHLSIKVSNPNITPKPWMFWINPMIPANDEVELIVPAKEMDTFGQKPKLWPIDAKGKDRRILGNWDDYDSLFAKDLQAGFAGMFDRSRSLGFVRSFPLDKACGVKIFSFGHSKQPTLQAGRYSDSARPYFELWGGYTRTFETPATLPAHGTLQWQEQWYPVACKDGYKSASQDLAVNYQLDRSGPRNKHAHITLFPSRDIANASVTVAVDGKLISSWHKDLKCGQSVGLDTGFLSDYSPAYLLVKQGSQTLLRCNIEELRERPKKEEPKQEEEQEVVKKKVVIPPPTLAELVQTDRLGAAIKLYESTRPMGPEAITYYGIALMRTGRSDEALKSFTSAARCNSATGLPAYLAGAIYQRQHNEAEARRWLEEAAKKKDTWTSDDTELSNAGPNNITALAAGMVSASRSGDTTTTDKVLEQIHQVNIDDAIVYGSDRAAMLLEEALQARPNDSRLMLYLAMTYQSRKSYQAAFDMAAEAAQADPTLARAYLIQAQTLWRMPKTDENRRKLDNKAAEYMDKCLALNPTHPGCYYFAGWIYSNVYRNRAELAASKKLYELDPYNHLSWANLGQEALWENYDYPGAVEWFTKLADSQDHESGYRMLGYTYRLWARSLVHDKKYDEALEKAAKGDEIDLGWTMFEYALAKAEALESTGKEQEARRVLEGTMPSCEESLGQEWPYDWYRVGCVYDKLGKHEKAVETWQKTLAKSQENLKKNPQEKWWNYYIAQSLCKLGKPQEALEAIKVLKPENSRWPEMQWVYEEIRAAAEQDRGSK